MKKIIIIYFQLFIIIAKEIITNPLRNNREKNDFWENNIWLFILLIIIIIILIALIILIIFKIYQSIKKEKNKKENEMVNSERSSQKYISE